MSALSRLLTITTRDGRSEYLVPWFVRAIGPSVAGSVVTCADGDTWEATEDPETLADRLLACQTPLTEVAAGE